MQFFADLQAKPLSQSRPGWTGDRQNGWCAPQKSFRPDPEAATMKHYGELPACRWRILGLIFHRKAPCTFKYASLSLAASMTFLSGPAALTLPSLSTISDKPAEGFPRRRPGDGGTTDGRSLCL